MIIGTTPISTLVIAITSITTAITPTVIPHTQVASIATIPPSVTRPLVALTATATPIPLANATSATMKKVQVCVPLASRAPTKAASAGDIAHRNQSSSRASVQQDVASLDGLLQLSCCRIGERDAVVVTKVNDRVAMRVSGDERLQLLNGLRSAEMV